MVRQNAFFALTTENLGKFQPARLNKIAVLMVRNELPVHIPHSLGCGNAKEATLMKDATNDLGHRTRVLRSAKSSDLPAPDAGPSDTGYVIKAWRRKTTLSCSDL